MSQFLLKGQKMLIFWHFLKIFDIWKMHPSATYNYYACCCLNTFALLQWFQHNTTLVPLKGWLEQQKDHMLKGKFENLKFKSHKDWFKLS